MDSQSIIEQYQKAIIQIATNTGTGTGFYLKEFDLIVTNDHVVAENAEVTIAGKALIKPFPGSGTPTASTTWLFWKHQRIPNCRM